MTSASFGERLDSNLNRTSLAQTSAGRELNAIRSGLFEHILAAPPSTPIPEPTGTVEVEAESSIFSPSSDTSSSDEQPAESRTVETDTEGEEVSVDSNVAVQVTVAQRVEPDSTETDSAEQLTDFEIKSAEPSKSEVVTPHTEKDAATTVGTTQQEREAKIEGSVEASEFETVEFNQQEAPAQAAVQAAPQTEAPKRESNSSLQEPEPKVAGLPQEQNRSELGGNEKPGQGKELATSTNTESVSEGSQDSGSDDGRRESSERELKWYQKENSDQYGEKRSAGGPTPVAETASEAQAKASGTASTPVDAAAVTSGDSSISASGAGVQVAQTSQPASPSPTSPTKSNIEQPGPVNAAKRLLGAPENRSQSPSTTKSAKPQITEPLDQQQQIRLIQRIARSFNRLNAEGGIVNLKLHPPQLGSLNVQVRLEGRDMAAKLTTETVAAKEAIIENLSVLRSRLSEQGFEISTFQVDVGGGQTDANSQGRAGQWAFSQGEPGFGQQYSGNGQGRNPLPQADTASQENVPQSVVDLFTDQSIDVHA